MKKNQNFAAGEINSLDSSDNVCSDIASTSNSIECWIADADKTQQSKHKDILKNLLLYHYQQNKDF